MKALASGLGLMLILVGATVAAYPYLPHQVKFDLGNRLQLLSVTVNVMNAKIDVSLMDMGSHSVVSQPSVGDKFYVKGRFYDSQTGQGYGGYWLHCCLLTKATVEESGNAYCLSAQTAGDGSFSSIADPNCYNWVEVRRDGIWSSYSQYVWSGNPEGKTFSFFMYFSGTTPNIYSQLQAVTVKAPVQPTASVSINGVAVQDSSSLTTTSPLNLQVTVTSEADKVYGATVKWSGHASGSKVLGKISSNVYQGQIDLSSGTYTVKVTLDTVAGLMVALNLQGMKVSSMPFIMPADWPLALLGCLTMTAGLIVFCRARKEEK